MQSQQSEQVVQTKQLRVKRQPAEDPRNATYSFVEEDHTLGNIVRNQIVKNKHVEFCAYAMPHPSEQIVNVRVQLAEGSGDDLDTNKVLRASLKRVSKMCDALQDKFAHRLAEFKASDNMEE